MLYSYFFNMLKVGVPGFTQTPQLLVYNLFKHCVNTRCFFYTYFQQAKVHSVVIAEMR